MSKVIGTMMGADLGKIIEAMDAGKEVYMLVKVTNNTTICQIGATKDIIIIEGEQKELENVPEFIPLAQEPEEVYPWDEEQELKEDIKSFVMENFSNDDFQEEQKPAPKRRGRPKRL